MRSATLRRSRIVQCLIYGCLLCALSALPSIILQMTGMFPKMVPAADEIALAGGVPAALAGAIAWLVIVLLRGHTAPTGSGILACWLPTVIGSYALVPIWIGANAVWRRCSFGDGPPIDQCWEVFSGMAAATAMVSPWGFLFTAPVVLPFLLFGAWLWVRRLHPAMAGASGIHSAVSR